MRVLISLGPARDAATWHQNLGPKERNGFDALRLDRTKGITLEPDGYCLMSRRGVRSKREPPPMVRTSRTAGRKAKLKYTLSIEG